ncbi:MAG: manganese catalase family protein [Bacillota bacterium]
MFKHEKTLLYPVRVSGPDPTFAAMLVEQHGGPNGELSASTQYLNQAVGCKDPAIKDLLLDIGTEELSHLELVSEAIKLLLGDPTFDSISQAPTLELAGGGGAMYVNSSGHTWTADFVSSVGDVVANLHADVAAELKAKAVYQRLYQRATDPGIKDLIDFLICREEAHAQLFMRALERVQNQGVLQNLGDKLYSNQYLDLSTGVNNQDPAIWNMQPGNIPVASPSH